MIEDFNELNLTPERKDHYGFPIAWIERCL
jgi:hypothetical protein